MTKVKDPGFGYKSSKNAQRMINLDGSSNIVHKNKRKGFYDLYSYLIEISWTQFLLLVFLEYTLLNILFALVYFFIGIEEITPSTGFWWRDLLNGFFFSAQTVTTVGYGGISPQGLTANVIASFEAMIGLLNFSFITGLLYGRFSKPKASIKFSKNLILRDFNGERALMFRLMNRRDTIMIEPEITVNLSITEPSNNGYKRNFYQLKLERNKITYLPTIWTVVHMIDKESPLFKYSDKEMQELEAELYILLQYHDESFSQKLFRIYSYQFEDLLLNVKFEPSYHYDEKGFTVLDHETLDNTIEM